MRRISIIAGIASVAVCGLGPLSPPWTLSAQESAQDTLPTPRRLEAPIPPPEGLPELLKKHRAEREALESAFDSISRDVESGTGTGDTESAVLRLRIHESLARIARKRATAAAAGPAPKAPSLLAPSLTLPKVPSEHADSKSEPHLPVEALPKTIGSHPLPVETVSRSATPKMIDPAAVAHSLLRAGQYEAALKVYQAIDFKESLYEDRPPMQYLAATCLRHVGKIEDANGLYREVANSRTDPYLATCAQWQLATMRWQQAMLERLGEIKKRRADLEPSP